ncbi:hypothetical protein GCM10011611_36370 [Aliidongia dinghuensis]|uniref:Uncharacterized protein n=1 Tax=Aliidongia dinghuensis TaxID=1867774 RepID=A0A8J2YX17_9PROT|nr:hypothetical protein [Aliidongia dinghuensis]GGF27066.1 hypothetical protein GCM10011611_36370 [Aliidongia dinghuensis]
MSTKNISLALLAAALTAGLGTAAYAHRSLTVSTAAHVQPICTTTYSIETGADGQSVSVTSLTCSRPAQRVASEAAL